MRYEVILAPEAVEDLRRLRKHAYAEVNDTIERHLRYAPKRVSKSRIKRLRGLRSPQYRLRSGEIRIFYDVVGSEVQIRGVVMKSDVNEWLTAFGEPS